MPVITKEMVRWDARSLAHQVDEAVEHVPDSELAPLHEKIQSALAALEQARGRPNDGSYKVAVSPEQMASYFPAAESSRREISPEEREKADAHWAAARERGRRYRDEALAQIGPTLTPGQVSERLGLTTVTVSNWRRRGKLLALRFDDHQHLYPAFQFVTSPSEGEQGVLRHLDEVLPRLGDRSGWQKAQFLLTPAPYLGGQAPIALLRAGDAGDLARVLRLAERAGELGT